MTSTVEVLQKARALIEKRRNWTQGAWARTRWLRFYVVPEARNAYAFCASGAIRRCAGEGTRLESRAWRALYTAIDMSVIGFNDTHTHAEVLDAFDRAIELAKSSTATESLSNSEGA
jgi:hypothetical protein